MHPVGALRHCNGDVTLAWATGSLGYAGLRILFYGVRFQCETLSSDPSGRRLLDQSIRHVCTLPQRVRGEADLLGGMGDRFHKRAPSGPFARES